MMKYLIFLTVCVAAILGCSDKSSLCSRYSKSQCSHIWLRLNCQRFCGYCNGTVSTEAPTTRPIVSETPGCSDKSSICSRYSKSQCSHIWLRLNCQRFCGYCNGTASTEAPTTRPIVSETPGCSDKSSFCSRYSKSQCSHFWLKMNCQRFCGYCNGTSPTEAPTARPSVSVTPGQCGRPQVAQSRVVGGKTAAAHSWPWQIGLHRSGRFICGGSVVNNRWIVTAAHCIYRKSAKYFTVKFGDHDRYKDEGEQTIQVKRIIAHPGYGNLNNDIALLELEKPVMFGKHVQPVCLPRQGDKPVVGSTCYITGWGKIKHPGSSTQFLQQLGLKIQSKDKCASKNGYTRITDQMLCAANTDVLANQSGCHGDSGGPFVCQNDDGSWTLEGAVSWGSPRCNIKEAFTVFARVAEFRNWIDQYINKL